MLVHRNRPAIHRIRQSCGFRMAGTLQQSRGSDLDFHQASAACEPAGGHLVARQSRRRLATRIVLSETRPTLMTDGRLDSSAPAERRADAIGWRWIVPAKPYRSAAPGWP